MQRLLTISDLTAPDNDWKPLLDHVSALQAIHTRYKATMRGDRHIEVHIGGNKSRAPGLHASELCGCLRQAAYSLLGAEKQVEEGSTDVNMLMRFDIGHLLHALLQDDFQRMCLMMDGRLVFEDEVRINEKTCDVAAHYKIASSTDGIFTFYDEHDSPYLRVGLEIKSKSAPEYEKLKKPLVENTMQGTLYQKCHDLPLMWYLYYNKSNSNYTPPLFPWLVTFSASEWNAVESRAKQVHTFVQQGTLPEREEGMPCSWCPYAKACEPTYNSRSAARTTSTPPTQRVRRLT